MAGHWWLSVPVVAIALAARRVWALACAAACVTAVVLGAVQAEAVRASGLVEGQRLHVAVRLVAASRAHEGMAGPWWSARGTVVEGSARARVSISGNGEQALQAGDVVRATVLVAASDTAGEAARLRIRGQPDIVSASGSAARIRDSMRDLAGDSDPGWLLSGMTLGMDEGLTQPAAENMRASGLSHLTAVSGANCAVLMVLVLWLCGWLRLGRVPRVVVALVVLVGFTAVVGPQPSVLRASVMAGLALIAGVVGGRRAAAHVLQVAVIGLLIIDPWLAYSVGFMLSIAATAGLIALVQRGPLAATVAAQVATFPILLAIGGAVGLRTVIANVVVTPLAAAIPVVGLTSLSVQAIAGLGAPFAAVGRLLTSLVLSVAAWQLPGDLSWAPGWAGVALAVIVAVVVLTVGRRHAVLVAAVMVVGLSLTARWADRWPPRDWWLVACDVGQGDGLVVRAATATIVVDTGPDPEPIDQCLRRLGIERVDLLVITHFHADHVAGVRGVLRGRSVGEVWVSPCSEPDEQFDESMRTLATLPVSVPPAGAAYRVGDSAVHVLGPRRIINAGSVPNNASISFLLTGPHGRALFLGDLEEEGQAALMREADLSAEIVKVPHHGSAKFDPRLPAAVSPDIALVGVGADNAYGHPTAEALTAWQQTGANVLTTMDNGDIAVLSEREVAVRGVSRAPAR